jgi:TRAP-type C4-dicarboxylate transport system substrate-binding protein
VRTRNAVVAAVLASSALASCSSPSSSDTLKGGAADRVPVLIAYTDLTPDQNGQSYAGPALLAALSASTSPAFDVTTRRPEGDPAEIGVDPTVSALRAGDANLGWVPARELANAGIPAFDVLSAPLVLTSYAAQAAMTEPANATPFLDSARGSGLVALALTVGGLRRPVASEQPLVTRDSWAGRRVRSLSPIEVAAHEGLGATPVRRSSGFAIGVPAGAFDGGETDVATWTRQEEDSSAPYLTSNVVLWPKMWVVVANQSWFDGLDDQSRDAVVGAVETARQASVSGSHDERADIATACERGSRVATASSADVAELRSTLAPVVEALGADPQRRGLLDLVHRVAADFPAPDELTAPVFCRGSVSPREKVTGYPSTPSDIPVGTYRMHLTADDIRAAGSDRTDDAQVITFTVLPGGRYTSSSRFDDNGETVLFESGRMYGGGDLVVWVNDLEELKRLKAEGRSVCDPSTDSGCVTSVAPASARWARAADGSLTFRDVRGVNPLPIFTLCLIAHPYVKIA